MMRSVQAPQAVVMVRPHHFRPNPTTEPDNHFQVRGCARLSHDVALSAFDEVTRAAEALVRAGVAVHLFEDEGADTPDSVFPNNWFSTHAGGHVAIYPMHAPNRRAERRHDIIEMLKSCYRVQDVIDYSGLEMDGLYLEGTGAMVLDHIERVAYVARSNRADAVILERFCTHFNFEPMVFDAADAEGQAIYHTNVMMCIGTRFTIAALDAITNPLRRGEVGERLAAGGRSLVRLSHAQMAAFAGNAIELHGHGGAVLALSQRALDALLPEQIKEIARHAELLPLSVPTVELAGGSVRCMIAGIHLSARRPGEALRAPGN